MATWSPSRSSTNNPARKSVNQGILASLGIRSRKSIASPQASKTALYISEPRAVAPDISHPAQAQPCQLPLSLPNGDKAPQVPARHHSRQASRSSQNTVKAGVLPAEPVTPTSKVISSLPYLSPQPSLDMDSNSSLETCNDDDDRSARDEQLKQVSLQQLPAVEGGEALEPEKIRTNALTTVYGLSPDLDSTESMSSLVSYDAQSSTASLYVHQAEQIPVSVSSAHTIDYHP